MNVGRDNVTQINSYDSPVDSGNKGRVRAVTAWVEQMPIDDALWIVTVHNGSRGPITGLVVDVYLVDAEGNRTDGECAPAKHRISFAQLFERLISQALPGAFGAIQAQAQANPWMQGMSYGGVPNLGAYGGMMAGQMSGHPQLRAQLAQFQAGMTDTFPRVVASLQQTQVVFYAQTADKVFVDIAFDDEDGQRWFRRDGEEPAAVSE